MSPEYLHHTHHEFHVSPCELEPPSRNQWIMVRARHWSGEMPMRVTARRNCLTELIVRNPRLHITATIQPRHVLSAVEDQHQLLLLEISNG